MTAVAPGRCGASASMVFEPVPASAGSDQLPSRFERAPVWLDAGDPIELIIHDRLEHEWSARVQSQVDDRICDDRDDAPERTADHAIALRRELT